MSRHTKPNLKPIQVRPIQQPLFLHPSGDNAWSHTCLIGELIDGPFGMGKGSQAPTAPAGFRYFCEARKADIGFRYLLSLHSSKVWSPERQWECGEGFGQ